MLINEVRWTGGIEVAEVLLELGLHRTIKNIGYE